MYSGIAELGGISDEQLAQLYEGKNIFNLLINQYVLAINNDKEVKGRWTDSGLTPLKYSKIKNDAFGLFTPRNIQQEFAFDALQDESRTGVLLAGNFGSGKSILSLVHALHFLQKSKKQYKQIVFLRNNIITKNSCDVGALPDSLTQKLKPFAMFMADIIGGEEGLDKYIEEGKIVIDHIGFIRGRSYKDSIVYVSEAQNLTKDQASLIVSRIAEGSRLFIEGDMRQYDRDIFNKESGMKAMAESLKGDPEFAMVTLYKNERSRFASLSDKILDWES